MRRSRLAAMTLGLAAVLAGLVATRPREAVDRSAPKVERSPARRASAVVDPVAAEWLDGGPMAPAAEAREEDRTLLVFDERARPLPDLAVEVLEADEDDGEAAGCDEPNHLAQHLERWRRRPPVAVVHRGRTDADGGLSLSGIELPAVVRVRTADGLRVGQRAVSAPGEVFLEAFGGVEPWHLEVVSSALAPVASATVAVFDPSTGQLAESAADAFGRFELARCAWCVALVQAPGFVPRAVELRSDETVVRLARPGRIEVRAPWAPDGLEVSLLLGHPRETTMQGGVARFDEVPAGGATLVVPSAIVEHSQKLRVEEGETLVVHVPLWKGASLSLSVASADGQPVSEASVSVDPRSPNFSGLGFTAPVDEPGDRLELDGLPEGPAQLTVSSPGWRTAVRDIVLVPGLNELHLELEAIAATRGTVVDARGRPIEGAVITVGRKPGVLCDALGRFSIDLEEDDEGEVSAPGFETKEVPLRQGQSVQVHLERVVPVRVTALDAAGHAIDGEALTLVPLIEGSRVRCEVVDGGCEVQVRLDLSYRLESERGDLEPPVLRVRAPGELHPVRFAPRPRRVEPVEEETERRRTVIRFSR
ncbi:MAG: carboxypeptidase-like regulatory domain-containing protein [Myxococcaceae bacterium]|nr:carboxypeptidase-like regulatory domain-containing protein [Myxococcaceae bacterium]